MKKAALVCLGFVFTFLCFGQSYTTIATTSSVPAQVFAQGDYMYSLHGSPGFGFRLIGMNLLDIKDSVSLLEGIYQDGINIHNFVRFSEVNGKLYIIAELGRHTITGAALYEIKKNSISKLADLGKSKIRGLHPSDDGEKLFIPLKDLDASTEAEKLLVHDVAAQTTTEVIKGDVKIKEGAILEKEFIFTWEDKNGVEPWISDGTSAGTQLLTDLESGSGSSLPYNFLEFNGWVYFNGFKGASLGSFRTDGKLVEPLVESETGQGLGGIIPINHTDDHLLFTSVNAQNKNLFSMDKDFDVDTLTTEVFEEVQVVHNKVYFTTANADVDGKVNFYVSDGTSNGTEVFFDIGGEEGQDWVKPQEIGQIVGYGHDILFIQDEVGDFLRGQIWYSNGTKKGTRKVLDTIDTYKSPDTTYNLTTSTNLFLTNGNIYFHSLNTDIQGYWFLQITGLTSIQDGIDAKEPMGYPNPVKDQLNVDFKNEQNRIVKLYDMSGKQIHIRELRAGDSRLNLSGLEAGIYLIQLNTNEESTQFKILKE